MLGLGLLCGWCPAGGGRRGALSSCLPAWFCPFVLVFVLPGAALPPSPFRLPPVHCCSLSVCLFAFFGVWLVISKTLYAFRSLGSCIFGFISCDCLLYAAYSRAGNLRLKLRFFLLYIWASMPFLTVCFDFVCARVSYCSFACLNIYIYIRRLLGSCLL